MSNYVYNDHLIKTRKIYRRISLVSHLIIGFILASAMASTRRFIDKVSLYSITRLEFRHTLPL